MGGDGKRYSWEGQGNGSRGPRPRYGPKVVVGGDRALRIIIT